MWGKPILPSGVRTVKILYSCSCLKTENAKTITMFPQDSQFTLSNFLVKLGSVSLEGLEEGKVVRRTHITRARVHENYWIHHFQTCDMNHLLPSRKSNIEKFIRELTVSALLHKFRQFLDTLGSIMRQLGSSVLNSTPKA